MSAEPAYLPHGVLFCETEEQRAAEPATRKAAADRAEREVKLELIRARRKILIEGAPARVHGLIDSMAAKAYREIHIHAEALRAHYARGVSLTRSLAQRRRYAEL